MYFISHIFALDSADYLKKNNLFSSYGGSPSYAMYHHRENNKSKEEGKDHESIQ